ncbi:HTH Tnp Tc3 2 domain containing protein, partial [Asbolus verrucosus]
ENRLLTISGRRDPFTTTPKLRNQLQDATGTNASVRTFRNRVLNLKCRRPLTCISLTPEHRRQRYDWCNNHVYLERRVESCYVH